MFLVAAIIFEGYDVFSNESKQILYSNAVSPNIILTGARDITLPTEDEIVSGMTNEERYNYYLNESHMIAHAGGGIDGKSYSNSYESLDLAYRNGIRIFEVDIYTTVDGYYVLSHDALVSTMTYEQFMTKKVYGRYTPMNLSDVVDVMKSHKYAYIIPDIKQYNKGDVLLSIYQELFNYTGGNKNVSNRIIGTFKRVDMLEYVSKYVDFDIKILYYRNTVKQEQVINTYEKFVEYCLKNDIHNVVLSTLQFSANTANKLNNKKLNVIVYTIDNKSIFEQYIFRGADGIMTNFLVPQKEERI